jgi:DNA-3-methyladenine glycosylase I
VRCAWVRSARDIVYHDTEWGVPLHDERRLFEFVVLEGAQAGLSWATILARREGYRQAFDGFDPERVARYGEPERARLLADPGIIRNRLKIDAAIGNAKAFLAVQARWGSFDRFLWDHVDGQPIQGAWATHTEVPVHTPLAVDLSRELRSLGFRFVGPTIVYSLLQATGVVNDHLVGCFRCAPLAATASSPGAIA